MRIRTTLLTAAAAAAGMYFFDPERGAVRRENLNATLGRAKPKDPGASTAANPLWTPRPDQRDGFNDAPATPAPTPPGNGATLDPSIGDPVSSAVTPAETDAP